MLGYPYATRSRAARGPSRGRPRRYPTKRLPYNPLTDPALSWHWAAYAGDPEQAKPADGGTWSSWRAVGTETAALEQATDTKQLIWNARDDTFNGLASWEGDGVDDFAQTANWSGTLAQGWVIICLGSISANGKVLFDGNDATHRGLFWRDAGGNWEANNGAIIQAAGADSDPHGFVSVGAGPNSTILVDGTQVVTGNGGTQGLDGITLFGNTSGAAANGGKAVFIGVMGAGTFLAADFTRFAQFFNRHGFTIA